MLTPAFRISSSVLFTRSERNPRTTFLAISGPMPGMASSCSRLSLSTSSIVWCLVASFAETSRPSRKMPKL